MDFNRYRTNEDLRLLREMTGLSQADLAARLGVSYVTVSRWETSAGIISAENLEAIYSFAYDQGIRLNAIKEQFYLEDIGPRERLLFHGAKKVIEGSIRTDIARNNNDFGTGFYMGESFRQAALFISNFPDSCVYALTFDDSDLKKAEYKVDQEWLLTIAAFRGRLKGRVPQETIDRICSKANEADFIVAPIADNRMYQIINSFVDGEITDEQCTHALAATDLGMQIVANSEKAASRIRVLERCYLCTGERKQFVTGRTEELAAADNKVRAARIKYRGVGKYIDELL